MVVKTKWLIIAVFAALLVAVLLASVRPSRTPSSPSALPSADLSSPEQALKSYWRVRDWLRRYQAGEVSYAGPQIDADELMRHVTSGSAQGSFGKRPVTNARLSWSNEGIERPSDTKAIAMVRIRNLDQDPSTLTPTPLELFDRYEAGLYRYVLANEANQWKVAEVWRVDAKGVAHRLR